MLNKQTLTVGVLFTIFIFVWEEFQFSSYQGMYLHSALGSHLPDRIAIALLSSVASFLLLTFFVIATLVSSRHFRNFYILLFVSVLMIQTSYWGTVHRFFHSLDLYTAFHSSPNLWATAVRMYFHWGFLLPAAGLILIVIFFGSSAAPGHGNSALLAAILAASILAWGLTRMHLRPEAYPGSSIFRFFQTVFEFTESTLTPSQREKVHYRSPKTPDNNIVLIIDESIRADHLSINGYERKTTPFLEQLAGRNDLFHNWGEIASGGTCSLIANSLLLTGVTVEPGSYPRTRSYPTLFQYAKAMGYHTMYLDAQTSTLWNGLETRDLDWVDELLNVNQLGMDIQSDFKAAEVIRRTVSTSRGNFIVLNKKGVHFLYQDTYPPEFAIWSPTPEGKETRPDLVINAYDNGIRYKVDRFFETLLSDVDQATQNTVYLYTSDHGQTLFENGETWLHCNHTYNEALVPLIIIGRLENPLTVGTPASHSRLFATVLDLMGTPPTARAFVYSPSLFDRPAAEQRRYYFDGALRVIPFDATD